MYLVIYVFIIHSCFTVYNSNLTRSHKKASCESLSCDCDALRFNWLQDCCSTLSCLGFAAHGRSSQRCNQLDRAYPQRWPSLLLQQGRNPNLCQMGTLQESLTMSLQYFLAALSRSSILFNSFVEVRVSISSRVPTRYLSPSFQFGSPGLESGDQSIELGQTRVFEKCR